MIEIGHRVNLLDPTAVTDRILDHVYCQWNHVTAFVWKQQCDYIVAKHESAFAHTTSSVFRVSDPQRHDVRYTFEDAIDLLHDIPSGLFTPPSDFSDSSFHSLPADSSWLDPFEGFGRREKTSEFFVHNHNRGFSYHFSHPTNCAFFKTTDLLTVIRAHEAQNTEYRLYRNTSVWNTASQFLPPKLDFTNSPAEALKSTLMGSCASCDGLVGVDGVCEQCVFPGVDLVTILDDFRAPYPRNPNPNRTHIVTMRTHSSTQPKYFDPNVDYSIRDSSRPRTLPNAFEH